MFNAGSMICSHCVNMSSRDAVAVDGDNVCVWLSGSVQFWATVRVNVCVWVSGSVQCWATVRVNVCACISGSVQCWATVRVTTLTSI